MSGLRVHLPQPKPAAGETARVGPAVHPARHESLPAPDSAGRQAVRSALGRAEAAAAPDAGLSTPALTPVLPGIRSAAAGVIRRQPRNPADLDDPARFDQINQALFAQSTTGAPLRPFVNPSPGVPGTAEDIKTQFIQGFTRFVAANPAAVGGTVVARTTEADADADAATAQQQLLARFPFLPGPLSGAQLSGRVTVFDESIAADPAFVRARLTDRLFESTDIGEFNIQTTDPRFQLMLTDILADPFVGPRFPILAGRAGAFTSSSPGTPSEIFLHEGLDAGQRMRTLMHEITHFFAHDDFRAWLNQSPGETFFNEGFTEFLARLAMTPSQLADREAERANRRAPFEAVRDRVARFVSDDDLARAYFLGEVWRLEASTQVAQQIFARQVGLPAAPPGPAEGAAERAASATARGIVQEVIPGEKYRFMNFDIGESGGRPEHVAAFRDILRRHVLGRPDARVEFAGFASAPGSADVNLALSLRRARAFYALARAEGVPAGQLVNESNPRHLGETSPTASDAGAHGRAFNRRVEMLITLAPASPGALP